jgi:hypothetical protein
MSMRGILFVALMATLLGVTAGLKCYVYNSTEKVCNSFGLNTVSNNKDKCEKADGSLTGACNWTLGKDLFGSVAGSCNAVGTNPSDLSVSKQMTCPETLGKPVCYRTFTMDQFGTATDLSARCGQATNYTGKTTIWNYCPNMQCPLKEKCVVFMYYENAQDWYSVCGKCDGTGPYRSFRAEFFLCLNIA